MLWRLPGSIWKDWACKAIGDEVKPRPPLRSAFSTSAPVTTMGNHRAVSQMRDLPERLNVIV